MSPHPWSAWLSSRTTWSGSRRTLRTLDPSYQREIDLSAYEVILVDNGSGRPVDERLLGGFGGAIRHLRIDPAPPSPARAANIGIGEARADLVGLIIDGARMVSPDWSPPRCWLHDWPIGRSSPLRHGTSGRPPTCGPPRQDTPTWRMPMLRDAGWANNGYVLFGLATLAGSSWRGWFGATSESSSLFLRAETWRALDGSTSGSTCPVVAW